MDPLELVQRRGAAKLPPGARPRLRLVDNSCRRARWDCFFRPGPRAAAGGGGGRDGRAKPTRGVTMTEKQVSTSGYNSNLWASRRQRA